MYRFHKTVQIKTSTALGIIIGLSLICGFFVVFYSHKVIAEFNLTAGVGEASLQS